jgi:hypothetical protein
MSVSNPTEAQGRVCRDGMPCFVLISLFDRNAVFWNTRGTLARFSFKKNVTRRVLVRFYECGGQ